MPPADQDGKKPGTPANPLADLGVGGDLFDWDQAIDEWDPTFLSQNELPPELSEAMDASKIPVPADAGLAMPAGAAAPVATPAVAGTPVSAKAPAKPAGEGDAAPLPPPPMDAADALQLEIELVQPASGAGPRLATQQDVSAALDAQKQRLLAGVVTTSDSRTAAFRHRTWLTTRAMRSRSRRRRPGSPLR